MPPPYRHHLFVCTNERPKDNPKGSCKAKGSEEVLAAFKQLVKERKLGATVRVCASGCLDACAQGISVVVYPEAVWYGAVTPADVPEIVEAHLGRGEPVARLRMKL